MVSANFLFHTARNPHSAESKNFIRILSDFLISAEILQLLSLQRVDFRKRINPEHSFGNSAMNTLRSCHVFDRPFRSVVCLLMVVIAGGHCGADEPASGVPQKETAPSPESPRAMGQQQTALPTTDSLDAPMLSPFAHSRAAVVREPRLFTAGQRNAEIVIQFPGRSRYSVTVNGTEHQVFGSQLHLRTSISRRTGAEVRISVRHLGLAPEVQLGANALTLSEPVGDPKTIVDNVSIMRLQAGDGFDLQTQTAGSDSPKSAMSELCIVLHAGSVVRISALTPQGEESGR